MSEVIEVVENPRRRRHRSRRLSAAQLKAGFGGRSRMSANRRRTTRRRNPGLATISNPRRRYRRARMAVNPRRYYRRRRNPSSLGIKSILYNSAGLAAGIVTAQITPGLIAKVWPGVPRSGITGHLVKAGGVVGVSMLVGKLAKNRNLQMSILSGGIAKILYDVAAEYVFPKIGLSLSGYSTPLTMRQLKRVGISGSVGSYSKTVRTGRIDPVMAI